MDRSTEPPVESTIDQRRLPTAGGAAIAAALIANFIVYFVGRAINAIPDNLPDSMSMFGPGAIIFITVLTLTIATIAMWGFSQFSQMPIRNFTILSVIIFVTSLPPVFGSESISARFIITLVLMHAVTAFIAWWCLTRIPQTSSTR